MKKLFRDCDKFLLILTIVFSLYGLFNLVTASSREAVSNLNQSMFFYFFRHLLILIAGFICGLIVLNTPFKKYKKFLPLLFFVTLGLNVWLIFRGTNTRGANNWIDLGFFNLQPSEVSKPVVIVCLAFLFEQFQKRFQDNKHRHADQLWIVIIVGLIIPVVVFMQKDLGTAIILLVIFCVMFVLSPILLKDKIKTILSVVVIGVVGIIAMYSIQGYILSKAQLARFDYHDPCKNYSSSGYQICNAFIAINKGGAFGVGIGKSTQKYSYIPEPHTDMVFAIIAEENGIIGCTLIFIAYIIIIYRILNIAKIANTTKGRYICLGVATYIFMHIFINLGGLFGLIPLTGVPLPFLSYGGSFTLSLIISLMIVQRVHIETVRNIGGNKNA